MKNLIIIAIVSLITSFANAEDFFTIQGKKISLHEQRSDMISKLGKPSETTSTSVDWDAGKHVVYAKFDKWGLDNLIFNHGSVTIDKKVITIGKDTPKTIKTKLLSFCQQVDDGLTAKVFTQTTRVGAEGEINIVFTSVVNPGVSGSILENTPISTLQLTYEDPLSNPTCKY